MRRRDFINVVAGSAVTWPLRAHAQQPAKKMLRVGTVSSLQRSSSPTWAAFLRRMAELGYQEGKTFAFDLVEAANEEQIENGYRTLTAREPDIIMATGPEIALKSALAATRTLPIVMIAIDYDPFAEGQARITAFRQGLQKLGWTEGQNVRIDIRSTGGDPALDRKFATELVALAPDVILATASQTVAALQAESRTVPIVFANAVDPVGAGFVDSLARPGGNATGFVLFEYGMGAKWLELLKEIAPNVTRVAVLRDPAIASGTGQFGAIQSVAPTFGVELTPLNVRDPDEIERAISAFAHSSNGGLIVTAAPLALVHRDLIVTLANRHRLCAVYSVRAFVTAGGLIYYGPDVFDLFRRAAGYVDRILKGEKPTDLPVQAPTKFEMVINIKTAKALGITVPPTLLARADEVIE